MMKTASIYRRLPGRGTALAHYVRLYQGPDHLLQVSSTGFTENYRRFYFRDIQAFVIEKKYWHHAWSAFWLGLALVFLLPALLTSGVGFIVLASIGGTLLMGVPLNVALGTSCACYVQTAVQTEKLLTLKRVRSARKFLNRIQPVILTAQEQTVQSI